jgi:hypothetical protein
MVTLPFSIRAVDFSTAPGVLYWLPAGRLLSRGNS